MAAREVSAETKLDTERARADLLQAEVDESRGKLASLVAAKNSLEAQLEQVKEGLRESQENERRARDWSEELDVRLKNDYYKLGQLREEKVGLELQATTNLDRAEAAEKRLRDAEDQLACRNAEAEAELARQRVELEAVSAREKAGYLRILASFQNQLSGQSSVSALPENLMQVTRSMYQVARELRIEAVQARMDDRRRLEKRYARRGQVSVATAVGAVYEELSLPEEQRRFTPARVCERLGLDINNLDSDYYVGLLGDEADVRYPQDVLEELERRGAGGQVPVTPPSGTLSVPETQPPGQRPTQAPEAPSGQQAGPSLALGS